MNKKLPIIIVGIFGIVFVVILGVSVFYLLVQQPKQPPEDQGLLNETLPKGDTGVELSQNQILYDCLGHIIQKGKDMLIIQTNQELVPGKNTLKVYITPETKFTLLTLIKKEDLITVDNERDLDYSGVKEGDEVVVITDEKPIGKTEIEALKVRVIKRDF